MFLRATQGVDNRLTKNSLFSPDGKVTPHSFAYEFAHSSEGSNRWADVRNLRLAASNVGGRAAWERVEFCHSLGPEVVPRKLSENGNRAN